MTPQEPLLISLLYFKSFLLFTSTKHSLWDFFSPKFYGSSIFLSALAPIPPLSDTSLFEYFRAHSWTLCYFHSTFFSNLMSSFTEWSSLMFVSWVDSCINTVVGISSVQGPRPAQPQRVQVKVVMLFPKCSLSCQHHLQSHFHLPSCLLKHGKQTCKSLHLLVSLTPAV